MPRWTWVLPALGVVVVGAVPFVRYAQKGRSEAAIVDVLRALHAAQAEFRQSGNGTGYAITIESLRSCTDQRTVSLGMDARAVPEYEVKVRAAEGATPLPPDCHGRPTTSDYYASAVPTSVAAAGKQAFAMTATGRIFVFFDGIAPLERDMAPSGLATPLESVPTLKIP